MHMLLIALLMAPLTQEPAAAAPKGDPAAGQQPFRAKLCYMCHGENGEGGFGPDIAGGRGLTFDQFRRAIRKPWGVMLAYTEQQLTDQNIADIYAMMLTKPKVQQPGEWHWRPAPANAALGQRLYMQTVGCGQCHEPENKFGRKWLGEHAKEVNFEYFAKQIYQHTEKYPRGGMGNYSRDRVPESVLREIYQWMVVDIGMRASVNSALAIADQKDGNTTYKLTIRNPGVKDVGLNAEGLTAFVTVPKGTKVIGGTGTGYKGVQPLATLGLEPGLPLAPHAHDDSGHVERPKQDLSGDVIVWKFPKLNAGDSLEFTFTLAGAPSAEIVKGFDGSTVYWEKPGRTAKGSPPIMVYRDLRVPDKGDHERIAPPRFPPPAASN
jgi:mono/diheme cytochrome c family protein